MEKRFPALRTIASILKIFAWISAIGSVIGFFITVVGASKIGAYSRFSSGAGMLGGFLILLYGGLMMLIFYAWSEGILVILAIEENTRRLSEKP